MRIPYTALTLLLICLAIPLASAQDWRQWRGEHRDGIWQESGIVDSLPAGQLPIQWSVPVSPGYCGPTVAGGKVYVMDRQKEGSQIERVLCFDSKDGSLIWDFSYEAVYTIGYMAGPRASVTVEGNRAYAVGSMGHLHCFNADTGDVIWARDLEEQYDIEMPNWGIAASPLIYNDLLIQQVAGSDGTCIVAFNKMTGDEVWRALDERAGYAAPILIQQAGKDIAVCWTGESLSGLDAATGEVYWSHEMKPTRMPIGIGTPVYQNEQIFVSSFYDGSLMVTAPKDKLESKLVWRAIGKDEKSTGSDTSTTADGPISDGSVYGVHSMIGTSIIQDGYIYAVDSYGQFRCLEAATGRRVWEDLTAVKPNRWATIHMVRRGEKVWMLNEQGELMIAQLSPEGLDIQSRAQLISPTREQLNRRDGVVWSHPAFAEQSIFARSDDQLIRVSLAK